MNSIKKSLTTCVLLGNRCTYNRQSVLLDLMEEDPSINLNLIITGSILTSTFQEVRNEIKRKYKNVTEIQLTYRSTLSSMSYNVSYLQSYLVKKFLDIKPDICIPIADRWEQLALATTSACLNIPLVHIQGGEISGNIDDKIRNVISMFSEVHFPSHTYAAERLISFDREHVYNFGCPSIDLIKKHNIRRSTKSENYFICMFHPHTKELGSLSDQMKLLSESIYKFIEDTGKKCYWFLGNDDPGAEELKLENEYNDNIEFVENLTGVNYLQLLANADLIVGNSSSGIRESSFLGVPSVLLGKRQENRKKAWNAECIDFTTAEEINRLMKSIYTTNMFKSKMFGDGNASVKIIDKIKEIYL